MTVYADNAATTRLSDTALKAMMPYMQEVYGNPSSLHSVGQAAAEALYEARRAVAECIGADFGEIYFTSGGSEADNQAIVSAAMEGKAKGKTHIVSTAFEHHAVLHTLKKLEKEGFSVTYLDVHENGLVTADEVRNAITDNTALVTIMYANNEIGTIEPIAEIGAVCREKGVLFHTDAVQAVGHIAINVKEQNIEGIRLHNIIEGGAQERGKRAGTENIPGIVGMAAALKEAVSNLAENSDKVTAMRDTLIEGLSKVPHCILNGDKEHRLPGNVNFCFEGIEGESLLLLLDMKGICASSGSACTSGSLDPSHVLLAIGRPHEIAHGSLRLSICEYNTPEEMQYICEKVPEVVEYLRNMSPVWRDLKEGRRKYVIQ